MIGNQLHDYCGDDPIWGFVAQLGAERFTGEAQVGTGIKVRIYADEGEVYFAEREGDAPLQSRLVTSGALTPAQLARGGIFLDGSVSLAKLFVRDTTIDQHHVEMTVEQFTAGLLAEVAGQPAGPVALVPLRHHDTGLHQWARRLPASRQDSRVPAAPVSAAPLTAPPAAAPLTVPPQMPPMTSTPPTSPLAPPSHAAAPAPLPAPAAFETPVHTNAPVLAEPVVASGLPTLAANPTWTRAAEAEPADGAPDRYSPADFDELQLPKLASRSMSVAEISAAQAALTGEAPPEATTDAFAPTGLSTEGLPHLVGYVAPPIETPPIETPQIEAPDTELLGVDTDDLPPAPVSDAERGAFDTAPSEQYEPGTSWTPAAQNLAVVEIWEMVDVLLQSEDAEPTLVGVGAPEQRNGRWRRGKKG